MIVRLKRFLKNNLQLVIALVGLWLMFAPDYISDNLYAICRANSDISFFVEPILSSLAADLVHSILRILGVFILSCAIYFRSMPGNVAHSSDDRILGFFWRELALSFRRQGYACLMKEDFSRAIRKYSKAIQFDPTSKDGYYDRGLARLYRSDLNDAIEDFTEAILLVPDFANARFARGNAWQMTGELDRAIADYTEVIRLNPKNSDVYFYRAHARHQKGDLDEAIEDYTETIRIDSNQYDAYFNRALIWQMKKDFECVIQDCLQAILIDPQQDAAYNFIAWIKATCSVDEQRDGQMAIEYATKACERSAWKDWSNVDTLAAAYAETGDFTNAVTWVEKALDLAPAEATPRLTERLALYRAQKPYRDLRCNPIRDERDAL